jgi:hypothetical protein
MLEPLSSCDTVHQDFRLEGLVMTSDCSGSTIKPPALASCWIIRSPGGENTLKDEDWGAILGFSTEALASEFGTTVIGAGGFKCEEWFWAELVVMGLEDGFTGVVVDHVRGHQEKHILLFNAK